MNLTINTFSVNPLQVNCYVVSDETKEAVVIDCGCSTESEWNEIKAYAESEGLTLTHHLCTHLHFDHVWGCAYLFRDFQLYPEANYDDMDIYSHIDKQICSVVGFALPYPPMPPLGRSLMDGDKIAFGNTTFKVIATPGHSKGCICFYDEKNQVLFSGDTLFSSSCGRTDLEGGDFDELLDSLKKLFVLPDNTQVYCGHGPSTSIKREKDYNPFFYQ